MDPHKNLLLPYSLENSGRKEPFSEDMEVAALLCLAEAERKRKSGFLVGTPETITFLSKLHYPFWAIPWENNCLLIDGMETVSNSVSYFKPPEVEPFIEHLKRSTTIQELYRSTLRSHHETFSKFTAQTEIFIKGHVSDKELLSNISSVVKYDRKIQESAVEPPSTIPPKITRRNSVEIGDLIVGHSIKLQAEMKGLRFAVDAVTKETKLHVSKVRQELEQTRQRYEEQISNVRLDVDKRKEELERDHHKKIHEINKANRKMGNAKLREKEKWARKLLHLQQKKSEFEKRKELRKRRKDEVGEVRWNARLLDVRRRVSTVNAKIKRISDFIERSEKETKKTKKKLQVTYGKQVREEERRITDLENARDAEETKKKKVIDELYQETSIITNNIEGLIERKKERYSTLKEATFPWKVETVTLIVVPLYLIRYESEKKMRYRFHSPVVTRGHEGLVMKIRKTLRSYNLQSKINSLMKTRFKTLEKVVSSFEEKSNRDDKVQRILNQLGQSHNLLTSPHFKEKVKGGLHKLESEGWIKPEEKTALIDMYLTETQDSS